MARIHSKKYRAAARAKAKAEAKAAAERQYLAEIHQTPCPNCNAQNTALILYGLPSFDEQMKQDLDKGLLVLGGCDLMETNPKLHCNQCGHEWG
ncbi:hypothetical protein [Acaryochloris marina]|uniref:Uncharacterized protein n=1 Tax=Acaryochloris marina (strain MBIC 11017) TaxID=329726 RepID=B0BYN4_ACAM1|nr:hypothetical protein [Acaryochloris marina]ABW25919.1 hypothetical protein AM1_0877 [Acaryochloris marina MBIC11017]BDM80777.1 hypothetical protein AM10699_36450 [Acaryochloris marina MBIC10699]